MDDLHSGRMNTNRFLRPVRWILPVICIVLIGCSQSESSATTQREPNLATPATESREGPPEIPTPGKNSGVVAGRVVSVTTGAPLVSLAVYLGEFLPLQPGSDYLVTLQVETSPHTTTDNQGYFALGDIEPGSYPLVIWTPFKSLVVSDSTGEEELQVAVKAGELTNLGELKVQWP